MKKILFIFFALISILTLGSCGGNKTERLVVGMECDYEPFNYTEMKKTDTNVAIENVPGAYADGYDVRMAKRIADALGKELVIRAYQWEGLIPALNSKEIDLIIAGMSETEERKQTIDFTDPYYVSEEVILMKKASRFNTAKSINDFNGAKVIGQLGTIYADLVPQLVAKGAVAGVNLDTIPQIVNAMKQGVIDITIVELPVAKGIVASDTDLTYVTLNPGFEVDASDVAVSIGIRKNYELKDQINQALKNISLDDRVAIMDGVINR